MAQGHRLRKAFYLQMVNELAPSKELLDKWNTKKIKWENYVKQYKREQANSAAAKLAADAIGVMSTERIITLLCKERENDTDIF
jgi:uncharacterized protein YeaO (DUF488 family)